MRRRVGALDAARVTGDESRRSQNEGPIPPRFSAVGIGPWVTQLLSV